MASQKISAFVRDEIVKNVLAHKFVVERSAVSEKQAEIDRLKETRNNLGYEMVYSEAIRKALEKSPKGWFPTVRQVRVMVEDEGVSEVKFGKERLVPYEDYSGGYSRVTAIVSSDHPYFQANKQVDKLKEELRDYQRTVGDEERLASAKVLAVINSVTTTGKLIEIWPEVQSFMPEMVSSSSGGVPAEFIGDLNSYLNLA